MDMDTIELSIVDYCNMSCVHCASFCDVVKFDTIMDLDLIERFINESIKYKKFFKRIRLVGGEPTLHPQFFHVLSILKRYQDIYKACIIDIATNGINRINVPSWATVSNSHKIKFINDGYGFIPVLNDINHIPPLSDIGCFVPDYCGMGMTKYGIYPCSISGKMDMLLGLDVGLKSLNDINEQSLLNIMKIFCKNCGWRFFKTLEEFLKNMKKNSSGISCFWKNVIENFKGVRLSPY